MNQQRTRPPKIRVFPSAPPPDGPPTEAPKSNQPLDIPPDMARVYVKTTEGHLRYKHPTNVLPTDEIQRNKAGKPVVTRIPPGRPKSIPTNPPVAQPPKKAPVVAQPPVDNADQFIAALDLTHKVESLFADFPREVVALALIALHHRYNGRKDK